MTDAEARDRWARSARGPLALVNSQHVDQPQQVWPVPGTWAPAVGGLQVTAAASDGIVVDGVPVDSTVLVAGDDAVVASTVTFPDGMAATVAASGAGHTLRVWDPGAEAITRFARIDRFPPSDLVTSGRYTPVDRQEARGSVLDAAGEPLVVAGTIDTTIRGEIARILAVRSAPFGGSARLQLIVQDATSALPEDDPGSSYSMGRFLFVADPGGPAEVELDWNDLVLPPCAFSYQYACPIPPPENRLTVALEAGERHPLDTDGAVFH
ncbi:hypothetical protein BIU98_03680 [Curtobacterium sp. MMLR14_010]|uniref:DUF1684 domain-containing protein n=1 Tax=Curtobacterium sp. MMLR14_010 TaxID=1898743 RepID=UPI0008DDF2CF|nr:DUF1684 domain-containing protein [Curtobacterium sp. MMLR14_010]OII35049.1 hypothetical protein BIU98_03680 [Curtobacterium sp. MMLR14_010]